MENKDFEIGYIAYINSNNPDFPGLCIFSKNPSEIPNVKDMLSNYSGIDLGGGYEEDDFTDFTIDIMKRIKYIEEE